MNTTKNPNVTNRTTAILVGVLFIIGTAAGVLSVICLNPIQYHPDYLVQAAENQNQVILGALAVLTMGLSLAIVPVLMFPVSKKYNEPLALGYVVFRGGLETVTYLGMVTCWLVLIPLGQEYVQAGAPAAPYFQTMGALILGAQDSINTLLIIVFSLGALMLYAVLYPSKLIPRWISGWGFVAILLHFSTAFLVMFRIADINSPILTMMNLPIFFQEMVMAVWLIVKGFNPSAIAAGSAKQI
jgi:hypothetical protein